MAKKQKLGAGTETRSTFEDTLAATIANDLNAAYKKDLGKIAFIGSTESPSDIRGWIPTGCAMLDLAISNRPYGGVPIGRIIEITGLEASGKSLLAAHILVETQKLGGLAVYIDTEAALSKEFFEAIGIDVDKMLHLAMYTLEDIFSTIEMIITKVRESDRDRLVTIVIDSIMGARTKIEEEADYEKDGYATQKAIIMSKAMRKITSLIASEKITLICTNQLRVNLGATFGEKYSTSGGKALAFHSSVRLRLASVGKIKIQKDHDGVIGVKTKVSVIKNRLGPPHRTVEFDIYFESGIDDPGSWLETLKNFKLVKKDGHSYVIDLVDKSTGEVTAFKFASKDFHSVLANKELRDQIYERICDSYIMEYRPNVNIGIDDIHIDSESKDDE